jgi:outer membrane protein assembly factor BamA
MDAPASPKHWAGDVPFYDRYYLGGLYSLRGFKYRNIGPREPDISSGNPNVPDEPIGGDSYWFGSMEYSIPIIEKDRRPQRARSRCSMTPARSARDLFLLRQF